MFEGAHNIDLEIDRWSQCFHKVVGPSRDVHLIITEHRILWELSLSILPPEAWLTALPEPGFF